MTLSLSMDKALAKKQQLALRGADLKLFVRDVRDRQRRSRPITVRPWSTIKDIKDAIQQSIHIPVNSQRLFFGALLTSGKELPNHRSLQDAGILRSGETLLLDIKDSSSSSSSSSLSSSSTTNMTNFHLQSQSERRNDVAISSSVVDVTPRPLKQLVQQARRALVLGLKPEFILEGSGGTYFLHNTRKVKISVFKPADEEPYAENNPRGYLHQSGQHSFLREGVMPGEACIREVAAFMMDHQGFSGVPMTTLVEARHPSFHTNGSHLKVSEGGASIGVHSITDSISSLLPKKVGSFQEFIPCECSMDDISPSMITVDQVHKIAILDIRLMNADRNAANLLCRRRSDNSLDLVPIDHGFCLRSVADVSWMDWCWLDWPQTKQPMSEKTKQYILHLDIERDARILKERLQICQEALDYFCASCSILKAGVKAGLTLYEIAIMCCRNDNMGEVPSKLENLFSMAAELAESAIENGRWHHTVASRALEEQLVPTGGSFFAAQAQSQNTHAQSQSQNTYAQSASKVQKSVSSVDLSQYTKDIALIDSVQKKDTLPAMVQSTTSDSSSDNGEVEIEGHDDGDGDGDGDDDHGDGTNDDRDEWAANLILDVSMDKSMVASMKERSLSYDSDSSNESLSPGFWQTTPPNDDSSIHSDHDSVNWTPSNSPPNASFMESSLRHSFNPISNINNSNSIARRASIVLSQDEMGNNSFAQFRSPAKVTFSDLPPSTAQDRESRGLDGHPEYKHSNSDVGHTAIIPRKEPMLRRSQSYSAMTTLTAKKMEEEGNNKINTYRDAKPEKYREYFLKFVDLVIVCETTATAQSKLNLSTE